MKYKTASQEGYFLEKKLKSQLVSCFCRISFKERVETAYSRASRSFQKELSLANNDTEHTKLRKKTGLLHHSHLFIYNNFERLTRDLISALGFKNAPTFTSLFKEGDKNVVTLCALLPNVALVNTLISCDSNHDMHRILKGHLASQVYKTKSAAFAVRCIFQTQACPHEAQ